MTRCSGTSAVPKSTEGSTGSPAPESRPRATLQAGRHLQALLWGQSPLPPGAHGESSQQTTLGLQSTSSATLGK